MNKDSREFNFERSRGIVWVCDLSRSSRFLNDNQSVGALEEFLPRLYFVSMMAVEAAGGRFIKWNGDGFLSWFETPLHREVPEEATRVFLAAYTLTALVNISQLSVKSDQKFHIRHGICFEHDALMIKISHSNHESLDLIGRAAVLAFRLSGVPAKFPGIVTQKDLIVAGSPSKGYSWKKRSFTSEEKLKYFKGETWGAGSIYVSSGRTERSKSAKSLVKSGKKLLSSIETERDQPIDRDTFAAKFVSAMLSGPEWSQEAIKAFGDHAEEMYQLVKKFLSNLEQESGRISPHKGIMKKPYKP